MNGMTTVIKRHKADIIIITIVLFAAVFICVIAGSGDSKVTAEILQDGKLLYTFELGKTDGSHIVKLDNGIEILIENGAAGFISSGCPDKTCVKCGMLTRAGQTAVCVPNRTVIRLTGSSAALPDIVSY